MVTEDVLTGTVTVSRLWLECRTGGTIVDFELSIDTSISNFVAEKTSVCNNGNSILSV